MAWADTALASLKAHGVRTVVHVPDNVLTGLIRLAEADRELDVLGPTREEEGVGIVCGAYLGGSRGALLLQNSGLGNMGNAIASLAVPYGLPFVMLVSQRGDLGEFNAVQVGMGRALRPILDGLDVPHVTLEREEDVETVVGGACKLAFSTDRPVAVILSPLLTGGKDRP
jgi:sulfopyruvate decarboxylase alpha subunit